MKIESYLLPALGMVIILGNPVYAANYREAPLTPFDHKVDITDVYAFVSDDNPGKVTLIMNVDPLLEPSNGPTRFPFDPEILYTRCSSFCSMLILLSFFYFGKIKITFKIN